MTGMVRAIGQPRLVVVCGGCGAITLLPPDWSNAIFRCSSCEGLTVVRVDCLVCDWSAVPPPRWTAKAVDCPHCGSQVRSPVLPQGEQEVFVPVLPPDRELMGRPLRFPWIVFQFTLIAVNAVSLSVIGWVAGDSVAKWWSERQFLGFEQGEEGSMASQLPEPVSAVEESSVAGSGASGVGISAKVAAAREVLRRFSEANTLNELRDCVLMPDRLMERMRWYYQATLSGRLERKEEDDLSLANLLQPLDEEDVQRGIVLFVLDAKYRFTEGADLTVQLNSDSGLEDAVFGASRPILERVQRAPSPVLAEDPAALIYVKETADGMRLDWETFVQTRDRNWQAFLSQPTSDPKVFRVILRRSSPILGESDAVVQVTMRDPLWREHSIQVDVDMDSALGSELARELPMGVTRYATVSCRGVPDGESKLGETLIVLDRILCWELLGVGADERLIENLAP